MNKRLFYGLTGLFGFVGLLSGLVIEFAAPLEMGLIPTMLVFVLGGCGLGLILSMLVSATERIAEKGDDTTKQRVKYFWIVLSICLALALITIKLLTAIS